MLMRAVLSPLTVDPTGWLMLVVASVIGAVLLVLSLRFCTSQRAVVAARRKTLGCLLEMSFYGSDTVTTVRAFGAFLVANMRYLFLLLPVVLVSVLLLAPLYLGLDQVLGVREPLRGESMLIEVGPLEGAVPDLLGGERYVVEAGPVMAIEDGWYSWRVRRTGDSGSGFSLVDGDHAVWEFPAGDVAMLQNRYKIKDFQVACDWPQRGVRIGQAIYPWQIPFLFVLSLFAALLMKSWHVSI